MSQVKLFGLMVLAALIGFAAVVGGAALLRSGDPQIRRLAVGDMAEFTFADTPAPVETGGFLGPSGMALSFDDFRGRTILVNLWATWCAPCVEELPTLDKLQEVLGSQDFEVVTISIDRGRAAKAQGFFDRLKIRNLALYRDPTTKIGLGLKASGLPTTVLIDPEGREVGRFIGPADWASPEARALIKAFLPAETPAGRAAGGTGP